MSLGIDALIDLAGGELPASEAAALGLTPSRPGIACTALGEILRDENRCTILVGHIGGLPAIAAALGAAGELSPVALVRRALDAWGENAAAKLPGEWVLLDWQPGTVTLLQSAARWVPIFYARRGNRVAISADLFTLSRLPWIGREIDPNGLLIAFARGDVRGQRTILGGVSELRRGETVRISAGGTASSINLPFAPVPRWHGTFAQASDQASELLRQIVSERLARHGDVACLLSGGLDSSLLALTLADTLRPGQRLFAVTSVAPAGSGLPDEHRQAKSVADALGIALTPVAPDRLGNIYAPDPLVYAEANGPSLSVRHYLYHALNAQAEALGATGIFDGIFGEMTASALMPLDSPRWRLRQLAKRVLRRNLVDAGPSFNVRLAPHRMAAAMAAVGTERAAAEPQSRSSHEPWGYLPGAAKIMRTPSHRPGSLICEYPFRDQRLLQLFAGFPAHFLEQDGFNRAPARAMMAGRIPDAIRLRRDVQPFSPDYMERLQGDAPAARARISAFRRADIGDWLDLDWLDAALGAVAQRGPRDVGEAFDVQLTAMAAEFLLWWRYPAG